MFTIQIYAILFITTVMAMDLLPDMSMPKPPVPPSIPQSPNSPGIPNNPTHLNSPNAPSIPNNPVAVALPPPLLISQGQLSGWGWNPVNSEPETTTGWPATETITEGWGWELIYSPQLPPEIDGWSGLVQPVVYAVPAVEHEHIESESGIIGDFIDPMIATSSEWSESAQPEILTGWSPVDTSASTNGWSVEVTTSPPENTGWSPPSPSAAPSGWNWEPQLTQLVEVEIVGESAAVGGGAVEASIASQSSAASDGINPVSVQLDTETFASLAQGTDSEQGSVIGIGGADSGSSSSFQTIETVNLGDAGEIYTASLSGSQLTSASSGESYALGQGIIGQTGSIQHNVIPLPYVSLGSGGRN